MWVGGMRRSLLSPPPRRGIAVCGILSQTLSDFCIFQMLEPTRPIRRPGRVRSRFWLPNTRKIRRILCFCYLFARNCIQKPKMIKIAPTGTPSSPVSTPRCPSRPLNGPQHRQKLHPDAQNEENYIHRNRKQPNLASEIAYRRRK